jgi:hypothetical protein
VCSLDCAITLGVQHAQVCDEGGKWNASEPDIDEATQKMIASWMM